MTSDDFIAAMRLAVVDSAVANTIRRLSVPPTGKHVAQHATLSQWYNSLSEDDKQHIATIIEQAVKSAVFGFLCVIDGVRVIEPQGPKSDFRLMQHAPDGSVTCLNPAGGEMLHDIFNSV